MAAVFFEIDTKLNIPKHRQIANGITEAIHAKRIRRSAPLPSITDVSNALSLSRETVAKAYGELKSRGIIKSVPRKGYYVATEDTKHVLKVFLLVDELNAYQEKFYNSFKERLGDQFIIEPYFHHHNMKVFERLVLDNIGYYGMYVIKPFNDRRIPGILKKLEAEKVLIVDRNDYLDSDYNYIAQQFEKSGYECLKTALPLIQKYQRLVLVMPDIEYYPQGARKAFIKFCGEHSIKNEMIPSLEGRSVCPGDAYIIIDDSVLLEIIRICKNRGYGLGKDVGIISYNDTPMKELIQDGITVITIDWGRLGLDAAEFILNRTETKQVCEAKLIVRGSL